MEKVIFKMSDTKRRELLKLQKKTESIYVKEKGADPKTELDLYKQLYYLKRVVCENKQFLFESLLGKVKDPLDFALREKLYNSLFKDIRFLRLLVSESITNRLVKACKNGIIPNWLIEKIEMCALAVELYGVNRKN